MTTPEIVELPSVRIEREGWIQELLIDAAWDDELDLPTGCGPRCAIGAMVPNPDDKPFYGGEERIFNHARLVLYGAEKVDALVAEAEKRLIARHGRVPKSPHFTNDYPPEPYEIIYRWNDDPETTKDEVLEVLKGVGL